MNGMGFLIIAHTQLTRGEDSLGVITGSSRRHLSLIELKLENKRTLGVPLV